MSIHVNVRKLMTSPRMDWYSLNDRGLHPCFRTIARLRCLARRYKNEFTTMSSTLLTLLPGSTIIILAGREDCLLLLKVCVVTQPKAS